MFILAAVLAIARTGLSTLQMNRIGLITCIIDITLKYIKIFAAYAGR